MHHKILVIDKHLSLIGTSNLTPSSLIYHNNIILGIESKPLALWLCENIEKDSLSFKDNLEDMTLFAYLMPDRNKQALSHLIEEIDKAKISIEAALFSLTHKEIIAAFDRAISRGINIKILIDKTAMNSKISHLPIREYKGLELMHQKCCLIDDKVVIIGSVNWSEAGFNYNKDILLIIKNLQQKEIKKFRKAIGS